MGTDLMIISHSGVNCFGRAAPRAPKVYPRRVFFVFCMHVFACPCMPHLCVHACPVFVSMQALSVCPCMAALGHAHVHCIQACPNVPARHCGSGPSLVLPAEACVCLSWRPRTLTQGPSLQLEQAVRLESGELETQEPTGLVRQSVELRRQLQEEQASYRRKLQAYQEGQQRQAQLVQRLQAKVRAATPAPAYPCACSLRPAPTPWG